MANKLWLGENDSEVLDHRVERFTTGDDRLLDLQLLPFDIEGTKGHVASLLAAEKLDPEEGEQIESALDKLAEECEADKITSFPEGIEDCHSYIEFRLTEKLGPLGAKVHAGRSRNDQVLTALRLLEKSKLYELDRVLDALVAALDEAAKRWADLPMPGYSHSRRGMTVTVGVWLGSYYELFAEDQMLAQAARRQLDRSPLGAGAGFGNALGLDRTVSAAALGFARVQSNPLACMGSRGKDELLCLHVLSQALITASKLCADLLLFSSEQFGFCHLPDSLLTGSSMMPHKRNYDLIEIVRGNAAVVNGLYSQVSHLITGLGTGYHRDFQLTKRPLLEGFGLTLDSLEIMKLAVTELRIDPEAMASAIDTDMHSAQLVMEFVNKGTPFRTAYHLVRARMKREREKNGG